MLVTPSEFARAKGVSPAAVSTAMKERIAAAVSTNGKKRMIDLDEGLRLWDKNTRSTNTSKLSDAAKERNRRAPAEQPSAPLPDRPPTDQELQAFIMGLPEDQIPGVDVSRERREHYQAEKAKLEALQGRGELVPVASVRKAAQELGQALRDNVMGVPNRIAGMLAATTDTGEVTRLLEEELRVALRVMEATNA